MAGGRGRMRYTNQAKSGRKALPAQWRDRRSRIPAGRVPAGAPPPDAPESGPRPPSARRSRHPR